MKIGEMMMTEANFMSMEIVMSANQPRYSEIGPSTTLRELGPLKIGPQNKLLTCLNILGAPCDDTRSGRCIKPSETADQKMEATLGLEASQYLSVVPRTDLTKAR